MCWAGSVFTSSCFLSSDGGGNVLGGGEGVRGDGIISTVDLPTWTAGYCLRRSMCGWEEQLVSSLMNFW